MGEDAPPKEISEVSIVLRLIMLAYISLLNEPLKIFVFARLGPGRRKAEAQSP